MKVTALLRALFGACEQALGELGFRRLPAEVVAYGLQLNPDARGQVGLAWSIHQHRAGMRANVNPVVGVRFEPVERLVEELEGDDASLLPEGVLPKGYKIDKSIRETVLAWNLGYLMPDREYTEWVLAEPEDPPAAAAGIAEAVQRYGLAFMKANATLQEVRQALTDPGSHLREQRFKRLPVASLLLGERDRAREEMTRTLHELSASSDSRDQGLLPYFRPYADAFLAHLDDHAG